MHETLSRPSRPFVSFVVHNSPLNARSRMESRSASRAADDAVQLQSVPDSPLIFTASRSLS